MGTVEWIVLASVGVLVGLGLGFFLGRIGGGGKKKLADVEAELEEYRQEVSEHFSRSAEHFQAIGRQYRELYEHMAAGSEKLCVGAPSDGQLKFPRPDEVTAEASDEATPEDVEDAVTEDADSAKQDASSSEPEVTADEKAESAGDEDVKASEEDTDEAGKPSEKIETATAPVDYADDKPKDRQYH